MKKKSPYQLYNGVNEATQEQTTQTTRLILFLNLVTIKNHKKYINLNLFFIVI